MGYPYSIQLTQWSFASARDHPLLHQYIENLAHQLQKIANHHGGLQTSAARTELQALDPLTLTGPEAVTRAAQEWLNTSAGLRWNALTGLHDGGKAKLVDDVLILPITSFRWVSIGASINESSINKIFTVLGEENTVTWALSPSQIQQP